MIPNNQIKALLNLIEDPDEEIFIRVKNELLFLGVDVVPNIEQACEINLFCIQFLKTLYPNSSQMKKDELLTALRELDFMLLNISRQGLIPEIDNN